MPHNRAFATYTDVDGTTKRYIDMTEQMIDHVDRVGHTVIGLLSGTPWPVRERAFIAALNTMKRHEIEKVATFVDELQVAFRYGNDAEPRQKRRHDS